MNAIIFSNYMFCDVFTDLIHDVMDIRRISAHRTGGSRGLSFYRYAAPTLSSVLSPNLSHPLDLLFLPVTHGICKITIINKEPVHPLPKGGASRGETGGPGLGPGGLGRAVQIDY